MKFCPYCGAVYDDGTFSFCMECGKKLPSPETDQESEQRTKLLVKNEEGPEAEIEQTAHVREKARESDDGKRKVKREKTGRKKKLRQKAAEKPQDDMVPGQPIDDGYDGYYDDVLPPDLGRVKEGLDKELIKKVAVLVAVVLFVVILCALMMYFL